MTDTKPIFTETEDLRNRGLPKWPQMLVTGRLITREQAKEIIRRTDSFFTRGWGGNDHAYDARLRSKVGMPTEPGYKPEIGAWAAYEEKRAEWEKYWKTIATAYVRNDWVSCAFIGGPHGWCHPDGQIGFVDNVGKWPSIAEIETDWKALAKAFPFLDIAVTLMSGESCEEDTKPIVSMLVQHGEVQLVEPSDTLHAGHLRACRRTDEPGTDTGDFARRILLGVSQEHGLPWDWIEEWGAEWLHKYYKRNKQRPCHECMACRQNEPCLDPL